MASCNLKAIPGHEKVTSNNKAPPANEAMVKPEIVTIGNRALGNAWFKKIFSLDIPLHTAAFT